MWSLFLLRLWSAPIRDRLRHVWGAWTLSDFADEQGNRRQSRLFYLRHSSLTSKGALRATPFSAVCFLCTCLGEVL